MTAYGAVGSCVRCGLYLDHPVTAGIHDSMCSPARQPETTVDTPTHPAEGGALGHP